MLDDGVGLMIYPKGGGGMVELLDMVELKKNMLTMNYHFMDYWDVPADERNLTLRRVQVPLIVNPNF